MITIERRVHFGQGRGSRKELRDGEARSQVAAGRVPRESRLMALAIRFDQLIREGVVKDQAELARLGHVTRGRLTQIMNLLSLAPDIQEQLLFLPRAGQGRDAITGRQVRELLVNLGWAKQRQLWGKLRDCASLGVDG